jgi:Leucine-rich repeat (LRR) protein
VVPKIACCERIKIACCGGRPSRRADGGADALDERRPVLEKARPVGGRSSMGADASTLKKHLETASKTGALNLSDMKLKKVHDKVLQLSNLRTLDLSKNVLTEIPEPLGSMAGMKQFNVSYNAIPQLPPAVRRPDCLHLPPVRAHPVRIHEAETRRCLPVQLFGAWKSCEMINLSGNRLEALPPLDGMPRLKKLYLNGNALREIPESIAACASSPRVSSPAARRCLVRTAS